ncbi:MAG: hypothetical protein KGK03_03805 [Candidatus Omnitrophica bacterium]|nr:hypothetical protein [Candidatus Omnitrophota bacterium]MDE2222178.1 hypothetical protein [Candidatus Omnitrophota bacterium]
MKKFNTSVLICCFFLSGINFGWAAPAAIETPPVIVGPDDIQALNQQVLVLDRRNRDEEIAIKQLIDQNDRLAQAAQARRANEDLARIDEAMQGYNKALYTRDRERIAANSRAASSYADLISLTQDADKMTVHHELEDKSSLLTEKYEMLEILKQEMVALNEKLSRQSAMNLGQQQNVKALVDKLKQMDDKIKHLDDILAQKEEQIAGLNKTIADQQNQIAMLKAGRKGPSVNDALIQQKQEQIDLLKIELENQISKNKAGAELSKSGLEQQIAQNKEQIDLLKSELEKQVAQNKWLAQVVSVAKAKAEYYRLTSQLNQAPKVVPPDERIKLAQQLINLQQQQAALLEEKGELQMQEMAAFDRRFLVFEGKIKALLASRQLQDMASAARMQGLQNLLDQRQQQIADLKSALEKKIAEEKNQTLLAAQIRDLTAQLRDKEDEVAQLRSKVQQGDAFSMEADSLKQQLADAQDKADQLKQQLDAKTAEADKMTTLAGDYRQKLETANNAYNQELQRVMRLSNSKGYTQKEIDDLNLRLQQKEAEVIKIKKQMYDLQGALSAREMDIQAKDLSLSMVQQKMVNEKINDYQNKINRLKATNVRQLQEISKLRNDLDMVRQKAQGALPSSDEVEFLRTGLKKATEELSQKDQMLSEIKAHANEYEQEFDRQSAQLQSLKEQLRQARQEIRSKDDDLKYDGLAIARLKYFLDKSGKGSEEKLREELKVAGLKVKELQARVDHLQSFSNDDAVSRKLKQALDKIQEQGHIINLLSDKLQSYGQTMDLSKNIKE